jgi:ubiquitin conjugation factor E4 B
MEIWEDRQLGHIFRLSLKPEVTRDGASQPLHYIAGVREDLLEQNEPLQLKTGLLDQALPEAASLLKGITPLDYLLACWKRISKACRSMRTDIEDPKYLVLIEARRLCMSYCIFAITMPEMFGSDTPPENTLAKHLLAEPQSELGIDHDFLNEAVSRFEEDESIKIALVGAVEQLSNQLAAMSMNDIEYKHYLTALRNLIRYPKIVDAITRSPAFLPAGVAAQDIEKMTILGPFFRLSPLQNGVAQSFFTTPRSKDRAYIVNAQRSLRMTLNTHQEELFDLANMIVKSGKEPRERLLDWFAHCMNTNHKRRAMRVDEQTTSSDGFMMNITNCLDRLCDPFMDASFSKIDRIDVDYLRRNPRVDISDETKMNADQKASDAFYEQKAEGTNNFISEIFFLTVAAHHYGTEAASTRMEQMQKQVKHMEKELERFEGERQKYQHDARYAARFEQHLQKFRDDVDRVHSTIHATTGVLLDEVSQARSMQFMRYVIVWILRLASGQNLPKEALQLPLPQEQPEVFRCLPEYFLEDVVDNFKFITRNIPHIITPTQCEELASVCITFLRNSDYIKNPYMKSGLVTILHHGVWPSPNNPKGVLGDLLNGSAFCHKHLLHALMQFYIECESTGAHNQFYDKFNIRYEIFQVFKSIWSNVIYRQNLGKEADVNTNFFVRFVNLLLNDVTYVLDEVFGSFTKIHELQEELKAAGAEKMEQTERQQKEEALTEQQGRAKSYMGLTKETVAMLKLFTDALAVAFTMPEIVQRLADMLDYNLDSMVGPRQSNLKVDQPEQYGFKPKELLSDLVDVYLNLSTRESFHHAIARDGRSYKPSNFAQAMKLMEKFGLKSSEQIRQFCILTDAVAVVHAQEIMAEEDLGEIPDELLDPIMGSLMEDPVLLPSSRQIVDRSTIRSHLLSDATDPFNRVPLVIEDVLPAEEKKREIIEFIEMKRKEKAAAAVGDGGSSGAGEPMDTST